MQISSEKKTTTKAAKVLRRITLSGIFLAFALVMKMFSVNIPVFGAGGMKISFAGVFTAFPAFLFGPVYGGAVSALSDFLGWVIKPDGAYVPWLTLTAFAGGFIKGLLFRYVFLNLRDFRKTLSVILAGVFIFAGVAGAAIQISLGVDEISSSFIASADKLPTKAQINEKTGKLSFLSYIVTSTARYSKDTMTLTGAPDGEIVTIPSSVTVDGIECTVNKIAVNALAGCSAAAEFNIPAKIKTLAVTESENEDGKTVLTASPFGSLSGFTIKAPADSEAAHYAATYGIKYEKAKIEALKLDAQSQNGSIKSGSYSFASSDKYRSDLAGNINYATLGLEAFALLGLLFLGIGKLIARRRKKPDTGDADSTIEPAASKIGFVQIFLSIFIAGFIVTTVNTEILRRVLTVWNDRAFWVLWIPRAVEEMLVCMIQAYIITFLYKIYTDRIAPKGE